MIADIVIVLGRIFRTHRSRPKGGTGWSLSDSKDYVSFGRARKIEGRFGYWILFAFRSWMEDEVDIGLLVFFGWIR